MAIIQYTKDGNLVYEYLAQFPDQYVSEKEKEGDDFWKHNMDYFATVAYSQFIKNKHKFVNNYDLVKGIIRPSDFYEDARARSFVDHLEDEVELPSHVKHYPILNPPLNTLIGELTKRPDTSRVKAFDQDSQYEEGQFRTSMLQQYIMQLAWQGLTQELAARGEDISELEPQQAEELTMEKVQDYIASYSSLAERWGTNVLESMKVELNLKEKSEDAFRDLLICSREYYHVYETSSNSIGIDVRCENPKNVWNLTVPDRKYSRDWYAGGTVEVMELSEIIETFPKLTKEEIDHLRKGTEQFTLLNVRESNLGNSRTVGINSITYDTYDPLILRERMFIESQLKENVDELSDFLGLSNNVSAFGNKFSVVRAYWKSKKKVGKLTYYDEATGKPESILVDENYKNNDNPFQLGDVEWEWMNQWYYGYKIGPDVYHVEPYKLLPYCPIIGVVHEIKNTQARSLVDLMKPFQMVYNVCMNQLWKLLEKEIGVLYNVNIRKIPIPKDGDAQDALELWELEAREKGIGFEDDSPENMKAPSGNTNLSRAIDLTRTDEIQSRYNLAIQMKLECWELIGMSRERLGSVTSTKTATGIETALSQSYAQTEIYFSQHEYVLNELYQAILDAALTIQSERPTSTISWINGMGENAWVQVNGSELQLRDLKVFVTSRAKDQQAFQSLQQLAQAALQNGVSLYEVSQMYTTESMTKLQGTFEKLKNTQDQMIRQQQGLEQQRLQQEQEQFATAAETAEMARREAMINDNYQKELDRISKERVAIINSFSKQKDNLKDTDASGVPDILEVSRLAGEQTMAYNDYQLSLQDLTNQKQKLIQDREVELQKLDLEREKISVSREKIASDERIAKENKTAAEIKARQSKSKTKKK